MTLEEGFGCNFSNTGNSFASCFQFVESATPGKLHRRIKVYNKFLQLFQSRTFMMAVGMNTQAIFEPSFLKERVLDETKNLGWTRVEISYYATDAAAE